MVEQSEFLSLSKQNTEADSIQADNPQMLELQELLKEECEAIDSIYIDEGVVQSQPEYKVVQRYTLMDAPKPVKVHGKKGGKKQAAPKVELDLTPEPIVEIQFLLDPKTGLDETKQGCQVSLKLKIQQQYPKEGSLKFEIVNTRGLDDEEIAALKNDLKQTLQTQMEDESISEGDQILYSLFEELREVVSKYNDSCRGRCWVCLEDFCENQDEVDDVKFTDRDDLCRIDGCYHRFHLLCLHRDWFMERQVSKDQFGGNEHYEKPEEKRCPICRREASEKDVDHVQTTYASNPDFEDHSYG